MNLELWWIWGQIKFFSYETSPKPLATCYGGAAKALPCWFSSLSAIASLWSLCCSRQTETKAGVSSGKDGGWSRLWVWWGHLSSFADPERALLWSGVDESLTDWLRLITSVIILQRQTSVPRVREVLFPLESSDLISTASSAPNTSVVLGSNLTLRNVTLRLCNKDDKNTYVWG